MERECETMELEWNEEGGRKLEGLLQRMTGWSKLLVPFLVQNVGWFISAFLFMAGTLFVIVNTGGFLQAFIITVSLYSYTALMIYGGWQIKRRRPDIRITSEVLMTLAMLMIPLSFLASERMLSTGSAFAMYIGFPFTLAGVFVLLKGAGIATGTLERSLAPAHPAFFILLASLQFGGLILKPFPSMLLLGTFHLSIAAAFAAAVHRMGRDGFRQIFLESRSRALYAVGTLLFAASVSFVALAMNFGGTIPASYYAPFLMLFTGILFYGDARFKEVKSRYAFLSHVNFVLYALSASAIALSLGSEVAKLITLFLGAVLYGLVIQRCLTPVPLYLLLTCLGWLYGEVVLEPLPGKAHFLAALPALAGGYEIYRFLCRRGAESLARIAFRTTAAATVMLASWSLIQSSPGGTAFLTATAITVIAYSVLRFMPGDFFHGLGIPSESIGRALGDEEDLRGTPWFYLVAAGAALAAALAPPLAGLGGAAQLALSLALLAGIWTETALKNRLSPGRVKGLINSAAVALLAAPFLAFIGAGSPASFLLHAVLLLSGGILTRQGVALGSKRLVYPALVLGGAGAALFRKTFIPWPPTGMLEMAAVFLVTVAVRNLDRRTDGHAAPPEGLKILGLFAATPSTPTATLREPLIYLTGFLWLLSLILQTIHMQGSGVGLVQAGALFASSFITLLLCLYYRLTAFFSIPLVLAAAALMAFLHGMGFASPYPFALAAVLYAFAVWLHSIGFFGRRILPALAAYWSGSPLAEREQERLSASSRLTALALATAAVAATLFLWMAEPSILAAGPVAAGFLFAWNVGIYYGNRHIIYGALWLLVSIVMIFHCHYFGVTVPAALIFQQEAAVTALLTGFAFLLSLSLIDYFWMKTGAAEKYYSLLARPLYDAALPLTATGAFLLLIHGIVGKQPLPLFFFESAAAAAFFLFYRLKPRRIAVHLFLSALLAAGTAALLFSPAPLSHLPLLLSLGCGGLYAGMAAANSKGGEPGEVGHFADVLTAWLKGGLWLPPMGLLFLPVASLRESLFILLLQGGLFADAGWAWKSRRHISAARVMGVVFLFLWPLLFLPPGNTKGMVIAHDLWPLLAAQYERLKIVFPWYAFEMAAAALALSRLADKLKGSLSGEKACMKGFGAFPAGEYALALLFWLLNLAALDQGALEASPLYLWTNAPAALASAVILAYMTGRRAIARDSLPGHMAFTALLGLVWLYVRQILFGPLPVNLFDSAFLMFAGFGALGVKRFLPGQKGGRLFAAMALILPLSSFATLACQHPSRSVAACFSLAAGALYLTDYFGSKKKARLYGGVFLTNAALYLWIPVWLAGANLFQLYAVPAALSALVLGQLHKNELKRSVLGNIRMASLSLLYASATLDLYLRPELWVFGLFLALSLAGVAAGIALRVRAFLYSSVVFLVVNVLGQLIRFYPENGIGKGLLLMAAGTVIMGGMVWFNVKRESILKTVRICRADIAGWE